MKLFNLLLTIAILCPSLASAATLDELLKKVQQEGTLQTEENRKREQEFIQKRNQQKALLQKAKAELTAQERITARLTKEFEANEKVLTKLEDELTIAMGTLGEMFGVVKQVAGDLRGQFENSVVSAEIPNRTEFASTLAESKRLPNIAKLEQLWFEIQREMTETGKVTKFKTTVVKPDGEKVEQTVTRVVALTWSVMVVTLLIKEQQAKSLNWDVSLPLVLLERLMTSSPPALVIENFAIDPSRGSLLSMLVRAPSFSERIQQGGLVGYVIIMLLFLGIGLVVERVKTLKTECEKIRAQMTNSTASADNALGQIMLAFEDNKSADIETLELKMDEAILKSTPPLEKKNWNH